MDGNILNFKLIVVTVEKKNCKSCYKFNSTFKLLLENTDEKGKDYIENLVNNFLQINSTTFTNLTNSKTILPREKKDTYKILCKKRKK